MKKVEFKKYVQSPTLAVALVCFLLAGMSFIYPKQKTNTNTQHTSNTTVTTQPTPVLGASTGEPQEVVVTKVIYPASNAAGASVTPLPTQTTSNATSQTTSTTTSTQSSNPQVAMTITEPDGTSNFTINFHDGMTACDTLSEAKNEGKIKSVTIDSSYQTSLHSSYVKEINGYSNNWTFTANGQSPMGCSLYSVKQGDSVIWKYN